MKFDRRKVNRATALSWAALGAAAIVSPAKAAEFTYKLSHPDPVDFPTHDAVAHMASAVLKETGGRLDIQIFPNSVLGTEAAVLSQLRLGSLQLIWMNHSSYASVVPISQILQLGFIFTSNAQALKTIDGGLGEYMRKEFAAKGIFAFAPTGTTGPSGT